MTESLWLLALEVCVLSSLKLGAVVADVDALDAELCRWRRMANASLAVPSRDESLDDLADDDGEVCCSCCFADGLLSSSCNTSIPSHSIEILGASGCIIVCEGESSMAENSL